MKAFSFFKQIGRLLFLNVLVKPVWIFGVDRQIQNVTGHEAYGTYFSLLNLSLVFAFITDAGLSAMTNQQLASGASFNVVQLLRLKVLLAVVYGLLVGITAWLTGAHHWRILLLVIGIQILLSFLNFFRSIITAHQLFALDVWLSVVDKLLMLALFLPLLYMPLFQMPITLSFFLQMQLFCTAAATSIALFIIHKKKLLYTNAARQKITAVLKAITPFAVIILAMAAHNRLDGFLLERLHRNGAYEAGVYAASYRLLDSANMAGYLIASFLVPFLARHQDKALLVQQTVLTARYGLLLFGGVAALAAVFFAVPIQAALYPSSTYYTAVVLQWCLPVLPAYFLLHVYGSLLTARGQLKPFIYRLLLSVFINMVLNFLLIPYWGAVGCCVAALASQYTCAITVYFFAARKYKLPHAARQWGYLAVAALLLAWLFYAGRQQAMPLLFVLTASVVVVMLALFAYLPFFKRFYSLSR